LNEQQDNQKGTSFIFEFFSVILRWRRLLIVNTIAAAAITLAIMLIFFPNWYTATTTIMPPEKDIGSFSLGGGVLPSGLGALLGGSGMALPGLATPSDLYASILRSRAVGMAVIKKHNLKEVFDVDLDTKALMELFARTGVGVQAEGIISLSYEDTDPVRAAFIANSFVDELNRVNTENLVSRARATREFIERRLKESVADLQAAEENYKAFQQKHKLLSLEEQVKAAINTIANLKGELVLAEIELGVMKQSLSSNNIRYKNQLYKIEQIRKQIEEMESGQGAMGDSVTLGISIADAPELGLEYIRLERERQIQEKIFELLKQQYEQARIQEMRDTPTIQVLDVARVPELKSRPKRVFTAVLGGILSFGLTLFFVLAYEFAQREKEKESYLYARISELTGMLNSDIYWIRRIFSKKDKDNAG
jgi:tyrosine-protein kinase Etk/Wzc